MTKALRKAIMTRSRLKNAYLKTRNSKNWENYKKQRNFCTNLLKKTKSEYFRNLDMQDFNNNKKFRKKIKPIFPEKGLETDVIIKEKNELITNSSTLANLFNNYFVIITSTLKLKQSSLECHIS